VSYLAEHEAPGTRRRQSEAESVVGLRRREAVGEVALHPGELLARAAREHPVRRDRALPAELAASVDAGVVADDVAVRAALDPEEVDGSRFGRERGGRHEQSHDDGAERGSTRHPGRQCRRVATRAWRRRVLPETLYGRPGVTRAAGGHKPEITGNLMSYRVL